MLRPATLPGKWGIYTMRGWLGAIQLSPDALKVRLTDAPPVANWTLGKTHDSKVLGTYELRFTPAFETGSDNVLTVTIKDVASGQVIEEKSYGVGEAGVQKIRYLATGTKTSILFKLADPTPNAGSKLEVTNIGLNKTDFGDYRYGFNGKEKDTDINFGAYDFGARIYDSRIGKWLSTDPMFQERFFVSPYNYTQNNPILRVDPDGALDDYYFSEDGSLKYVDKKAGPDRFLQLGSDGSIRSQERGEFMLSSSMMKQYRHVKSKLASGEYKYSRGIWTPGMQGFKEPLSKLIGRPLVSGGLDKTQPMTGTPPLMGPGKLLKAGKWVGQLFSGGPAKRVLVNMGLNFTGQFGAHSLKMRLSKNEEWSFNGVMRRVDWHDTFLAGASGLLRPINTNSLGGIPNPMPFVGMSLIDWSVEKGLEVSFYNKSFNRTMLDTGVNTLGYGIGAFGQLGTGFTNFWSGFVSPNTKIFLKAGPLNLDNKGNLFEKLKKDTEDSKVR